MERIQASQQALPAELPGPDQFRDKGWNLNLTHLGLHALDAAW